MAIFSKKIKTEEKPEQKPAEKKIAKPIDKDVKRKTENYRVLQNPHITEKATNLVANNQYVFKVKKNTNKTEVKKVIESLYNVNVLEVNIINIHRRKRRLGRTMGHVPGYKKAIIKIREGQKIEVLPK